MGSPGSTPDVTPQDVRRLFRRLEQPSAPITAAEVAERLECSRETALVGLNELTERDEVRTRLIDDATRVWWRPEDVPAADRGPGDEEFTAFVNAVRDYAIFMLDPDGVVVSWNDGAERIKGYAEEEIVGEHFSTFYTDADVDDGVPEYNLETAATEGRVEDEGWRVRADGSRFWANVTITAIRDDEGALQGFTKVTRDMTERREYEQELRRERDLTERILETVPVSICVLTGEGDFVRANQRMLDRLGIEESGLAEYSVDSWELYDAEGEPIPADEWPWARVLETGERVDDFQCRVELPAIGRRWLSIDAAPLEDERHDDDRIVVSVDDITARKERERQLRREYEQTEKLLRTAPIAIAVQNADGETVLANERAQDALGLSEREIIEEPDSADEVALYDTDGEPIAPEETPSARVLATGEPVFDEEVVVDPRDGDRMRFRINAVPLFDAEGAIERVITTGEDITELKRRERQLERRKDELETELSEILGRISDAFYALDDEWRFTHLNEHAAELLGHAEDELLGREIWEVFTDAPDEVYRERFRTAMESQEAVSFEVHIEDIGSWLEFNVYPSESGLSIYFRDVTERVERERELEESERRYRTLVDHFPNGAVALVDEDLRYRTVGGDPVDVADVTSETIEGEPVVDAVPQKLADELVPRYEAALEGDAGAFEMELGGKIYQFHVVPVRDDDGDVFAALGMSQDITERREYERKLEESNERLEQFAYAASHDLQEPLRMVTSYLQLLERRYADDLDENATEFIEFAVDGAERMREMIDGLLEYSRVETRGDPFEPVDLNDVLADVRRDLQVRIEESGADVAVEDLPCVEGDPGQLRQVFQNLLDNALEYSGDEPPRVTVAAERREGRNTPERSSAERSSADHSSGLRGGEAASNGTAKPSPGPREDVSAAANDGGEWVVSVRDEGIGIDPADADRIFEVFQRLHSHEAHAGTGIGLALCRRIVERHGGDIWVESEPGEGATFYVSLPAER